MNLKNLVVSVGLLALISAPVLANDPTVPTDHPTAGAHPTDHPDTAHKTAKAPKKPVVKKGKKAPVEHPAEGTEAPAPAPGN